ncbi:restriction endonuclease subunit S [Nocardiopsis halotolerans]|uniref:restriction endonuclease subunit S n=1 Tax=Nocardiopsis halotolerans TaxID=124252 RepID=UPI000A008B4A|nr:restriction endonuclease subunit S [Nocardiopsis halotolerans]
MIYADVADIPLDRAPLLHAGEVLVVRSGAYTGDSAIVTEEWSGSAPGYDLRLTPEGVDSRYLSYSMLSAGVLQQIDVDKSRAAQPHLNAEDVGNVVIKLPGREEQQRIADFLDARTAEIDLIQCLRKKEMSLLQERMSASLVEKVLPGSDLPGWRRTVVKRMFDTCRSGFWGEEPSGYESDVVCVRVADFRRNSYRAGLDAETMRSVSPDQLRLRRLSPGDVLLEKSGGGEKSPVGFAVSFDGDRVAVCSNFLQFLRPAKGVDSRFAALVMSALYRSSRNIPFIKQTTGIQNIDLGGYLSQQLSIPDLRRQQEISITLDREIELTSSLGSSVSLQMERTEERKRALITAAVTGQIDVTTARGADLP